MKQRMISLLLALTLLVSMTAVLASCATPDPTTPPEGTYTRMTVDINPSVEFMVDDENKVISVTALNDDGSILIAGEAFVGLTPEQATELVISLATETGYLVKGRVEAGDNEIKISVSGDTAYAEALVKSVEQKAKDTLAALDIEGTVARIEAMKTEALQALAMDTALFTEEEVAAMTEQQLYAAIAAGRVETAQLLTEDMREAYLAAKEYEVSFANSEAMAHIIEQMGGLYAAAITGYKMALDAYSGAITALDEFRYDTLVSPESDYQRSLVALREAKAELLEQRQLVASLDINGETYASAVITLQASEEAYNTALQAYEALGVSLNASFESLITQLRECEGALRALEDNFSADIKAELTAKAQELERAVNAVKDGFFAEFEQAHKADIEAMEQMLIEQKNKLKEAAKAADAEQ